MPSFHAEPIVPAIVYYLRARIMLSARQSQPQVTLSYTRSAGFLLHRLSSSVVETRWQSAQVIMVHEYSVMFTST